MKAAGLGNEAGNGARNQSTVVQKWNQKWNLE